MQVFRFKRGRLGNYDYLANAGVQTDTYYPPSGGGKGITVFVQPEDVCSLEVYQFDDVGKAQLEYTEVAIAANERRPVSIPYPFAGGYFRVVNTDNNAGAAVVEVAENE